MFNMKVIALHKNKKEMGTSLKILIQDFGQKKKINAYFEQIFFESGLLSSLRYLNNRLQWLCLGWKAYSLSAVTTKCQIMKSIDHDLNKYHMANFCNWKLADSALKFEIC